MYVSGGALNKSMKKDSDHIATWESFINLPDNINNPLIIFRSKSKGFVILTEIKNHKEKPLMVAIHFNNKMKITEVKTIYAKTNLSIYSRWVKDNLVVFANKKSDLVKRIFAPIAKPLTKSHHKNYKK